MAAPGVLGLSVVEAGPDVELAEADLTRALVAIDLNPADADVDTGDIQFAIFSQFGSRVQPVEVSRFRSDFIVQFVTAAESSEILQGIGLALTC